MCFSATASFGATAVLSIAGIATLRKVTNPSQILFASLPLVFAVQQFTEGFVWLGLQNKEYAVLQHWGSIVFLVIAQIVWPIYVPVSMASIETNVRKRKILFAFLAIGMITSGYSCYSMFNYVYEVKIMSHHIMYRHFTPYELIIVGPIIYFIPTVASSFVSGIRRMHLFGTVMFISFVVSFIFFRDYLTSVWCYFAAILSMIVFLIISAIDKVPPVMKIYNYKIRL